MKSIFKYFAAIIITNYPNVFFCQVQVTDVNGKTYQTINIGSQTWMAENLDVDKFSNGDPILEVKTKEEWKNALNEKKPAWCYFENDTSNGMKFGKLYNYYAMSDPRGLAPIGYKVPSFSDWNILSSYLGNDSIAGYKLKSKYFWNEPRLGYNPTKYSDSTSTHFNALPAGWRDIDGFFGLGQLSLFWTSSLTTSNEEDNPELPDIVYIHIESDYLQYDDYYYVPMNNGFSIRCILK